MGAFKGRSVHTLSQQTSQCNFIQGYHPPWNLFHISLASWVRTDCTHSLVSLSVCMVEEDPNSLKEAERGKEPSLSPLKSPGKIYSYTTKSLYQWEKEKHFVFSHSLQHYSIVVTSQDLWCNLPALQLRYKMQRFSPLPLWTEGDFSASYPCTIPIIPMTGTLAGFPRHTKQTSSSPLP